MSNWVIFGNMLLKQGSIVGFEKAKHEDNFLIACTHHWVSSYIQVSEAFKDENDRDSRFEELHKSLSDLS